jgi:hypothetical protein
MFMILFLCLYGVLIITTIIVIIRHAMNCYYIRNPDKLIKKYKTEHLFK